LLISACKLVRRQTASLFKYVPKKAKRDFEGYKIKIYNVFFLQKFDCDYFNMYTKKYKKKLAFKIIYSEKEILQEKR